MNMIAGCVPSTGDRHVYSDGEGRLTAARVGELLEDDAGHLKVDVDAVEDGVQANAPLDELAAQWRDLLPLVRLVFFEAGYGAGAPHWLELYKAAANLVGHDVGDPRPPFAPLQGEHEARLRAILTNLDVVVPAAVD